MLLQVLQRRAFTFASHSSSSSSQNALAAFLQIWNSGCKLGELCRRIVFQGLEGGGRGRKERRRNCESFSSRVTTVEVRTQHYINNKAPKIERTEGQELEEIAQTRGF